MRATACPSNSTPPNASDAERANLLAVRVINPTREPIDGLVLAEVPHANKALAGDFRPGAGL